MVEIMSCDGLLSAPWTPNHRQSAIEVTGVGLQPLKFGDPYWSIELNYGGLLVPAYRALSAQFGRLDGGIGTMRCWRVNRAKPVNIPGADQGGVIQSFSVSGDEVTIDTSGGAMAPGDMLAYDAASGGRYVGELTEIVSSSGNQVTAKAIPPITAPDASPNASIYQAYGVFRMAVGSLSQVEPVGAGFGGLTVTMLQVEP